MHEIFNELKQEQHLGTVSYQNFSKKIDEVLELRMEIESDIPPPEKSKNIRNVYSKTPFLNYFSFFYQFFLLFKYLIERI